MNRQSLSWYLGWVGAKPSAILEESTNAIAKESISIEGCLPVSYSVFPLSHFPIGR
jgi:hypothetical protein